MGDFIIGGKTVTSLQINNKEVIRIANGQTVLWEKVTPVPVITYAESITQDTDTCTGWLETSSIDTGVAHATSTTTVRIIYQPKCGRNPQDVWNFSNRIVGYINHNVSNSDFRIFGYNSGTFDYNHYRNSSINIIDTNTVYDLTLGDCYVYDNQNNTYLCQTTTKGSVPTLNEHIFVDVQYTNVMRVIIQDGNTVLFDGKAAYDNLGHIGLYDEVSQSMKYNSDLQMRYEDYTPPTPVNPTLVDYVHTSTPTATANYISTGIVPTTDTVFKAVFKANSTVGTTIIGYDFTGPHSGGTPTAAVDDDKDYRLFNYSNISTFNFDFNNLRLTRPNVSANADGYVTITCGNNYLTDDITQGTTTGTTQSSMATQNVPIYLNVSSDLDFRSLEIWQNNVKVYDAHAAVLNGTYGVYDSVGGTFTTQTYGGNSMSGGNIQRDYLCFTAQQANSTIGYTSTLATPPTIYKSTDGTNFTSWDGTAVTLSNIGDTLYVYGTNQTLAESTNVQPFRNYTKFVMTGGIAAEGDATYLLQNGGLSTITNNYVLYGLFENCTSLTQAPSLPSTTLGRECYGHMFYGCTGLTQAPQLPATTLAYNCYVSMFYGCTSLTQAPTLSATTLAQGCYSYMFKGCTSLTTAPVLASTTLAYDCYYGMFEGCTALTTAPNLPATTITTDCYASMFKGCTSLTTAPQLPATTLDYGCYQEMFRGCTSLTQAPALPATTLLDNCYQQMFQGCTSLTTAPYLPATTLVQECYSGMFKDCSSLNSITCLATSISALLCTYNWLENVAATGTFTKSPDMSSWTTGASGIPTGWTTQDKIDYLCFTANAANCTVGMTNNGSNQPVMYYSTDQTNWTLWDYSNITLANIGDKVYFYGDNPNGFSSSSSNYSKFTTSGSVACSGNIMTLLTRDGSETTIPSDLCFYNLFYNNSITTAPELPATVVSQYAYNNMFERCTSLVTAPELPATTLAFACYNGMFKNCSSMTTAPSVLPATTASGNCYQYMFRSCTSLTRAPELKATTLEWACYNSMFLGCSQLNYIKVCATTWSTSFGNWVNGVAATGTFVKPAELVIGTGTGEIPQNATNGIPSGWTVVNILPSPEITYEDYTTECWDGSSAFDGDGHAVASYNTIQNATFYMRYCADGDDITQEVWDQTDDITIAPSGDYIIQAKATKSGFTDSPITTITATVEGHNECPEEPDPCQECYNACEGDPDCEADCEAEGGPCYDDPCADVDCSDCLNWNNECCSGMYESYEDCDCQVNGNCPEEEEEPEEEEPEP